MVFVYLGIGWLLGIWLGDYLAIDVRLWNAGALLALLGYVATRKTDVQVNLILIGLLAMCAGAVRTTLAAPTFSDNHIQQYNDNPRNLTLSGLVVDEPDVRDRSILLHLDVVTMSIRTLDNPQGVTVPVEGKVLVNALRFPLIEYGTYVQVSGKLTTPFETSEFSYKDYLARENIFSTMFLPKLTIIEEGRGHPIKHALFDFKRNSAETIARIIPSPQSSMLQAVLLGDTSDLPPPLVEDFRTTGLAHIIVVSGFHVAIIMLAIMGVAEPMIGSRTAVVLTIATLVLYALMVGGRPSVVRAVMMGSAYLIGSKLFGRNIFSIGILFAAAIGITAWNPQTLYDVGFQLSFMATLGIILYAAKLTNWAKAKLLNAGVAQRWLNGPLGTIVTVVMVSLAAQLLTLPLIAYYFKQISLISLVANALVLPVQPFVMIFGAIATLVGMAFEPVGVILGWMANVLLMYTVEVVEILARIPFASVPILLRYPAATLFAIYAAIGAYTWFISQEESTQLRLTERLLTNGAQRATAGVTVALTALVLSWSSAQPDGLLHVKFFDVGQGDAIFIQTPTGRQILIDAGYFPSIINAHLGRAMPFYDRTIDMVVATHPDADHVTGLPGIFDRYEIGQLLTAVSAREISDYYDAVLLKAAEQDVPVKRVQAGEVITIDDGVRLEIVHPGKELIEGSRNENSVSMRVVYGDLSILLTGDVESEGEREMVQRGLPLQSVVYKAGHHGSRSSSTPAFMAQVQPQIVIVSAGENNNFGHPHPEPLAAFAAMGATVLSTIDLGTIEVISDGKQMWWEATK